jgi:hypothetical protein
MKKHILGIMVLSAFLFGLGCRGDQRFDYSMVSFEGMYKVNKTFVSSKDLLGPVATTSMVLDSGGKCSLIDWPLSSLAIVSPGGGRPKGVDQFQGTWTIKENSKKYQIELQVRQSTTQGQNILLLTIQNLNPLTLKTILDVGSEDDFMLLEKIMSVSDNTTKKKQ